MALKPLSKQLWEMLVSLAAILGWDASAMSMQAKVIASEPSRGQDLVSEYSRIYAALYIPEDAVSHKLSS